MSGSGGHEEGLATSTAGEDGPIDFEAAYTEHYRWVRDQVGARIRDRHEAEDVTQEVFAKLFTSPKSYDPSRGSLASWLTTVARNRSIDHARRRRGCSPEDPERVSERFDRRAEEPDVVPEWFRADFESQFAHLSRGQRNVVFLRYWARLSTPEIASRLEVSEEVVRQHESRALRLLERRLSPSRDRETRAQRNEMAIRFRPSRVLAARRLSLTY